MSVYTYKYIIYFLSILCDCILARLCIQVSSAMMRATERLWMRMPKTRRPRERPWEIFNTRDFGYHEGAQNYSMWLLSAATVTILLGFEMFQQAQRIRARGDTCPACEAARAHYRLRVEAKEREVAEMAEYDHFINGTWSSPQLTSREHA